MKQLLLGATLALSATTAMAGLPESAIQYNGRVVCGSTMEWIEYHSEFSLEPKFAGETAQFIDEQGQLMDGTMVFWYNDETDTFSVTFTLDSNPDVTCVVTYGTTIVEM